MLVKINSLRKGNVFDMDGDEYFVETPSQEAQMLKDKEKPMVARNRKTHVQHHFFDGKLIVDYQMFY